MQFVSFLISWRCFFRVPFFGAFGFSPLTKGTQDSEGYQTKRAEGRAFILFSRWHQPKLHATIWKKGEFSLNIWPYICCWSLPHPSKKTVPLNDPNGIPQQDPSVGPTRCWWRCKPPDIPSLLGSMQGEVWLKRCWNQQLTQRRYSYNPQIWRRNLQITFNTQKPWSRRLLLFKMINIYQTSMALGSNNFNEKPLWDCFGPLSISMGSNISYTIIPSIYTLYIYMCHGINSNLWISDSMVRDGHQPSSKGFYTSHNMF